MSIIYPSLPGGPEGEPVFSERGRLIGYIISGTFRRTMRRSKHFHRKFLGWGLDICVLESLERRGLERVEVYDIERYGTDARCVYVTTPEAYRTHGRYVNDGYGRQFVLPLSYWTATDPLQPTLPGFGTAA